MTGSRQGRRTGARGKKRTVRGSGTRPSPRRILWVRTGLGGEVTGGLQSWTRVVARHRAADAQVIVNEIPSGQPRRDLVEGAVRRALSGLAGRWKVRIGPLEAFCVEVTGPDGLGCRAAVVNPARQGRRSLARRLRAACRRTGARGPARARKAWVLVTEGS